jgi:putative Mg2+ transporter-C (MgtC) family protein
MELHSDWFARVGDLAHIERTTIRLLVAAVLGGLVGFEREEHNKSAGLRTQMLVALGCALLVIIPAEAGATLEHMTRVIQGIAAGIGFLGAGAILKQEAAHRITGLTTAATIWITAALGTAVGLGLLVPAVITVILAWLILYVVGWAERRFGWPRHQD